MTALFALATALLWGLADFGGGCSPGACPR